IYSRVTITNDDPDGHSHTLCPAPTVSPTGPNAGLVSLTPGLPSCSTLGPGQSVTYDYVIAADRYGHNEYPWPTKTNLATANGGRTPRSEPKTLSPHQYQSMERKSFLPPQTL